MNRTSAKDFTKYPELLGEDAARVKAAHHAAEGYMRASALEAHGIIRRETFIGRDLQRRLADEIFAVPPGDGKRADSLVTAAPSDALSRVIAAAMQPEICGLFLQFHTEVAQKFLLNLYRQHLFNTPDDNDEQKIFHSDTFFPAIKFWYFPRAVDVDDGPLWYVPYSTVLTPALLAWRQRQIEAIAAGTVERWRGRGHAEGSLRISPVEIRELGLTPEPITVEADTLIIANVFGFHRRGDTTTPTHRLSLNGSIRLDNPI